MWKLDERRRNIQHTVLEKKKRGVERFRMGIWKVLEAESSAEGKFPLSCEELNAIFIMLQCPEMRIWTVQFLESK